VVVISR